MGREEPGGCLARLIAAEQALALRTAEAREEARRLVAQAKAEAKRADQELDGDLRESHEALRSRFEAERDRELGAMSERVRQQVAKLDRLGAEGIAELASEQLHAVLE